ncbi:TetR/AcrR family transcriptional regulator [Hyphobacterium indicum]|uniref:TetR/AcrR family transcriptional regulator n=1 Tax=Hyphobacterium indicum TaxID=2162714 RepID=UPI000D651C6F|nr:TetR/AcrR family transcriptional regulator [Hyphobacterium indicum]
MKTAAKSRTARRRPEERPDEILSAALDVFTEKGFAAARVEDIARRAGLSKGAVYLYFDSKDAMLKALVEQSAGQIANAASALSLMGAAHDPEKACRAILKMALTALSDPDISAAPRLVMAEAGRFPELAEFYRRRVIDVGRMAIGHLVRTGTQNGQFREVSEDAAMRALMGPALAHMMLSTVFRLPDDPEFNPADMADAIADIVLNGLKPRGDAHA